MNDRTPWQERAVAVEADAEIIARRFTGTTNPRQLRAIAALRRRPMPREHLDREAGVSNGPHLVAALRRRGLDIPCTLAPVIDRDGREVKRGIYHLSPRDQRAITLWLRLRGGQGAAFVGPQHREPLGLEAVVSQHLDDGQSRP
jgi:hypothetical protein